MTTELPPVRRSPTLEHVARAAGVSRATVSRVINGVRNVDPQIAEVVQRAIIEAGYVPNRAARSLVTGRTWSVALVVSASDDSAPDASGLDGAFGDPLFGRIAGSALAALAGRGVQLILMRVNNVASRNELLGHLRQGDIDGVILVSVAGADPLPRMLVEAGVAVVLFGRPSDPLAISHVDVDERAASALAVDHLVARGCRRIAMLCGPLDTRAGADRLSGFRDAMARHGRTEAPAVEGDFTQDGGEAAMLMLLDDAPDVDGVFVANDLMAYGALLALRDSGKRAPDDVAVVGLDDCSVALASRPMLTTVRRPVEDMAAQMVRLLLERIDNPDQQVSSVIFAPTLVVRDSA